MSLQTVYPWTVSTSELHLRGLAPRGEDEKTRKERMEAWEAWVYELNLNEDVPAIEQQQIAFGNRPRGVLASLINRDAQSGEAMRGDDGRLRQFWKRWRSDLSVPFNLFDRRWDEVLRRSGY